MDFLKNIAINLQAKGPAAVIIVWIICITALGLLGDGPLAGSALGVLAVVGGTILISLANKT